MTKIRVITNSERRAFACERRWAYSYVQGLSEYDTPAPFISGGLWHNILDYHYRTRNRRDGDRYLFVEADVVIPWLEAQREASKTASAPDAFFESKVEIAKECLGMFAHYFEHFGYDDAWKINEGDIEMQVSRDITNPDTGEPLVDSHGRRWIYAGRIDLPIEDANGEWIVEHKTSSSLDLMQVADGYLNSGQAIGYAWALQGMTGKTVSGVIWNIARKAVPAEVKILKNGKPSAATSEDTTVKKFAEAIAATGADPAEYTDKVVKLSRRQWFHRQMSPIGADMLQDFHRDIYETAKRMMIAEEQEYHPRQQAMCSGHATHSRCPFEIPCMTGSAMALKSYKLKTARHEELDTDLCESNFLQRKLGDNT